MLLVYIADAVWILALAAMASASRGAGKQIAEGARPPLAFGPGGQPLWRTTRRTAMALAPAAATVLGLLLLIAQRTALAQENGDAQLILFGLRLLTPSVLLLAHIVWLRRTLALLLAEGALKP